MMSLEANLNVGDMLSIGGSDKVWRLIFIRPDAWSDLGSKFVLANIDSGRVGSTSLQSIIRSNPSMVQECRFDYAIFS